jgi:hypothetical protein
MLESEKKTMCKKKKKQKKLKQFRHKPKVQYKLNKKSKNPNHSENIALFTCDWFKTLGKSG